MKLSLAAQHLLELTLPEGAHVARKGEALQLSLQRSGLQIAVTVPLTVREWFVTVTDFASGAKVEDWCDYEGYDTNSDEELDREMARDVNSFVQRLLERELRIAARRESHVVLEWRVVNRWEQSVPLIADSL